MRHLLAAFAFSMLSAFPAQARDLGPILADLGGEPCESGAQTCVTLKVPRDHFANDPKKHLKVTFAVNLATKKSMGVLFYVVGGPGGSGLLSADDYLSAFDSNLTENMDIVFFDQRGTGPETGLTCPVAQAVFDTADLPLTQKAVQRARAYVRDCIAELTRPELLGVVNTDQAIRDLEVFRLAIGVPKVWIYGESYGTQFAQAYATTFPTAVKGVILDGVVDLNLSFRSYYEDYTRASERILQRVFNSCPDLPGCTRDMQGHPADVYDELMQRLRGKPVTVQLPLGDGTIANRPLTAAMVETNAFYALYGPEDRTGFLRALAAASRGDLVPMLRLGYYNLTIDSETVSATADPSWFGAAYFAITCSDYADKGATPEDKAAAILAEAQALAPQTPRLLRTFYAERRVCAFWPKEGPTKRPEPFAGGAYPTLVMNADSDPITPLSMAYSVYHHARNASLIVMQGGPHVIWGRGFDCPDKIVARLLFDGVPPREPFQICGQDFVADYVPLTIPDPVKDADNPLTILNGIKVELENNPTLFTWYADDAITIGCDFGGTATLTPDEKGTLVDLDACQLWDGLILTGSAKDLEAALEMDLTIEGRHRGHLTYRLDNRTGAAVLDGTYDGKPALKAAGLIP